jgi:hypothetical protein
MQYKVRDLMINVLAGGGGANLPADDTTPVPTPITPIAIDAAMLAVTSQMRFALPIVKEALENNSLENGAAVAIAKAGLGARDGSPAFLQINRELAGTVAGAAVIQQRGGSVGLPNPECGGTSLETIPTPITPYVHKAAGLLQVQHLPRLKERLTAVLGAIEQVEKTLAPRGQAAAALQERLKGTMVELESLAKQR